MTARTIVAYIGATAFTIIELLVVGVGYQRWHWPPAILIPSIGLLTFFGVMIIVNLFSKSDDLRKGEIRNAIAASLLAVYFFLISVVLFAPASPLRSSDQPNLIGLSPTAVDSTKETSSPAVTTTSSAKRDKGASQNINGPKDSISSHDILKGLLDDFTKLLMIVFGFYFGGRSAEEIAKTMKK